MSKQVKRKITVNLTSKSKALPKARPSVFERLGTKANSSTPKDFCHHWAQNGSCPYGKGCKYSSTHTLISPSKQRAACKGTQIVGDSTKRAAQLRHEKNAQKIRHPGDNSEEWDQWDPDELEDADPDDLEKRRQELQRELELQMKMESKARKKEKKTTKKESSPSSESSSTSTESSTSSDESSSSSSSSVETRRKKTKKLKKRDSSSSSEERTHKHKLKSKRNTSKSSARNVEKVKKVKAIAKAKSPSPVRSRKQSQTPPIIKTKTVPKKSSSESKSPRPLSRLSDRKDKHHTPSPKPPAKDKEKDREKDKEREREREKEREREREREKAKERIKERERERERELKKKERSPKRDSRLKKRDTPDSTKDRKSPNRTKSTSRRDHKSPIKDDRRVDKRDDRDRSRPKDRPNDNKNRPKDKRDSRDRERERERERERRLAREEREAAREKEREEALARCQERQRERERLKELAKKEEERNRARERGRREDRGLDKPPSDRVERLLPLPEDRLPPGRKTHSTERERNDRRDRERRDRTPDSRISRKSPDRHDRLDRDIDKDRSFDRSYERSATDRTYDRDRDHDREYSSISSRKDYDSPYERSRHADDRRFVDIDEHYNENSREERLPIDREYGDDRRSRRDLWEDRELDRPFGRDGSRPPPKGRDWDNEYGEHEWERNAARRPPLEWENRENWDNIEHKHVNEEDWRHYNRPMESNWTPDERNRRWPADWRERSRPRSVTSSHNRDDEANIEVRRKDVPPPVRTEIPEPASVTKVTAEVEPQGVKRVAEQPLDEVIEAKKPCVKEVAPPPVLEDDLSEISDDADEILNRDEEIAEEMVEEPSQSDAIESVPIKEPTTIVSQKPQSPSPAVTPVQPQQPPQQQQRTPPPKEESMDEENIDLDFEEISEDELEEESRVKGIGDALGVDWASLVAESRPRTKPVSSAKKRWESHNVLVNLGVSVKFAGEALVKEILHEHAVAEQKDVSNETINLNGKVDNEDATAISHPIAAIQVANAEKVQTRRTLFSNVGPFRRALSARRDLAIRRHLCNLPINDLYVEAPKRHDPELLKIATQLFERCL